MKRLGKDAIKREAEARVDRSTLDLVARFGTWNETKILRQMERTMRNRRLEKRKKDLPGS